MKIEKFPKFTHPNLIYKSSYVYKSKHETSSKYAKKTFIYEELIEIQNVCRLLICWVGKTFSKPSIHKIEQFLGI